MLLDKNIAKIWVYNAGVDKHWQNTSYGIRKVNDPNEQIMFNRQGEIALFLAGAKDVIFLCEKPDKEFIEDIKKFGYTEPQIVILPEEKITISEYLYNHKEKLKNIDNLQQYEYIPYILSHYDEEICNAEQLRIYGTNAEIVKSVNDKMYARKFAENLKLPITVGDLCSSKQELKKAYQKLVDKGYSKFAIKEPYNSAGKGVYFIRDDKQFNSFVRMMRFSEDANFVVSIEEWLENKRDINYQIEILEDSSVNLIAITEQIISVTSYKGTIYPANLSLKEKKKYEEYAQIIGKELFKLGYRGLVGVDSMIKENGKIIPIIEFNARLNQSTYYIPILEYFSSKKCSTLIRSYDVKTNKKLDYKTLKEELIKKNLYYTDNSGEGIIILNSSSLSVYKNSKYNSRLFLGIIFKSNEKVQEKYLVMDEFVKYVQTL